MDNAAFDSGQESAERRCRARGHVFTRQTFQPGTPAPNNFAFEQSDECFRCGHKHESGNDLFKQEVG